MNAMVVFYSKFGHTRAVAEAIGDALAANGCTVHVQDAQKLTGADLAAIDLLVMGSPTHRMNLPPAVKTILAALPRRSLRRSARLAAFDTSYQLSPFLARFTAARTLARRLRRLGGKLAARPKTFIVLASEGPLADGEIDRARAWAETILQAS